MSGPPRRRRGGLEHAPPLEEVLVHQLQKFERGRTYPREGHGLFSRRVSKLSTLPFGSSRRTGSWGRENRTPKERTCQLVAQDKTTTAPAKGKAKPCNRSVDFDAVRRCGSGQKRLVTLSAPIGSGGRARRDMSRRWLKRRRGNVRMPSPSGHHVRAGQDRWCYGKVGQVHSEERWHLCDADLNCPSPSDLHAYDH